MSYLKNNFSLGTIAIILFGLFPILPNRIKGLPVILLFLSSLFYFINSVKNKKKIFPKYRLKPFFIMSGLYIFYLITIIYSNNLPYYFRKLEIGLSILIVPLSFLMSDKILSKEASSLFKRSYLIGVSLFSIIFLTHLFFYKNDRYPKGIYDVNFIRSSIQHITLIDTHPIYASLFFGIGILILISSFKKFNLYVFTFILVLLSLSITLLVSKIIIISLFILVMLMLFISIKKIEFKLFSILIVLGLLIISIVYLPTFNFRFKEIFKEKTYQKVSENNSTSFRNSINNCNYSLLKNSWLFGYGIGDVQDELNKCYLSRSPLLLKKMYNSHNQYISIWLGTGIFGLLIFIYMLFINYQVALENKDIFYLTILIFFTLNFLSESLLERQSGVILFSFLINFLIFSTLKKVHK